MRQMAFELDFVMTENGVRSTTALSCHFVLKLNASYILQAK